MVYRSELGNSVEILVGFHRIGICDGMLEIRNLLGIIVGKDVNGIMVGLLECSVTLLGLAFKMNQGLYLTSLLVRRNSRERRTGEKENFSRIAKKYLFILVTCNQITAKWLPNNWCDKDYTADVLKNSLTTTKIRYNSDCCKLSNHQKKNSGIRFYGIFFSETCLQQQRENYAECGSGYGIVDITKHNHQTTLSDYGKNCCKLSNSYICLSPTVGV